MERVELQLLGKNQLQLTQEGCLETSKARDDGGWDRGGDSGNAREPLLWSSYRPSIGIVSFIACPEDFGLCVPGSDSHSVAQQHVGVPKTLSRGLELQDFHNITKATQQAKSLPSPCLRGT
ncbi:uncharacterized protein LOC143660985 isoform X1 [Tamandua tetradactyla]|uniref:uncharacterized protein LOC143660985 isoform X1 n=1 Tax=Tamandua tetradactyla TaxID=48850 RepID=UPI00405472D3